MLLNLICEVKTCNYFTLNNGVPVYTIDAGAEEVLQVGTRCFTPATGLKNKVRIAATNFY